MSDEILFLFSSLDFSDDGLIAIDSTGKIKLHNKKALQIFGIDPRIGPGHPAGRLEPGDIVIITDNCLGRDDGNLAPEDLQAIGIEPAKVKVGDCLVAIGTYLTGEPATFKQAAGKNIALYKQMRGLSLSAFVNLEKRQNIITVDEQLYIFSFNRAVGNLVVLGGEDLRIKFYQTKGFTRRNEGIKSLLQGHHFVGKGVDAEIPQVLDKHLLTFYPPCQIITELLDAAKGEGPAVHNEKTTINGISIRVSIKQVLQQNLAVGAVLKVTDTSNLESLIIQRDEALTSLKQLEGKVRQEIHRTSAFEHIIGASEGLQKAIQQSLRASATNSTVLLLGESGTGKNLFAKAIHDAGLRANAPFLYINCAAIPDNLLESELFGYEKGAFTGAHTAGKTGKFEKADSGTIFLDEIADLSLPMQAKLLDFLQSRSFTKVGGLVSIQVDVRIIAATNKSLEELAAQKLFREDLYYRLNVFPIYIPPLRERPADIEALVRYLIPQICHRIGVAPKQVSKKAIDQLRCHPWIGNVRELENALERAVNMAEDNIITDADLPFLQNQEHGNCPIDVEFHRMVPLEEALAHVEKELIKKALSMTDGSKKAAIALLQMGKTNFYHRLKKYKLDL